MRNKILPLLLSVNIVFFGIATLPAVSTAATAPTTQSHQPAKIKAAGKAKFVLLGNVLSTNATSVTVRVISTSKNAKIFDGKDKVFSVSSTTRISESGKTIYLNQLKPGEKVKIFGIFDKKTGAVTLVRWIKAIPERK